MKLLIALFALGASMVPTAIAKNMAPTTDHSFTIRHYGATGHGCAVNGLTITNRHMLDPRKAGKREELPRIFFRYSFSNGQEGRGRSTGVSMYADVGTVELQDEPANGYAKLADAPKIGDRIHWIEYDFRKRKNLFQGRLREGKIVTILAGMVVVDEAVTKGASGGCAYNEANEVIGLMEFFSRSYDGKTAGGIAGIWGDWWLDVAP